MWSRLRFQKQKWHHLPDNFPQPQQQHQQRRVTTLSTPMTTEMNEHNAGSPNDARPSFGQGMLFDLLLPLLMSFTFF